MTSIAFFASSATSRGICLPLAPQATGPTKEYNHKNRRNQRRPPGFNPKLMQRCRAQVRHESHNRSGPCKTAGQTQQAESKRFHSGIGTRRRYRDSQSRQKARGQNERTRMLMHAILDAVTPLNYGWKPIEPMRKPRAEQVEVELIPSRSTKCACNHDAQRI